MVLTIVLAVEAMLSPWRQLVAAAPWTPRSDPQLAVLGNQLLLLGGHANNKYFNDCWSSADGGNTWSQLPSPPWENRSYHTAKVWNGTLYMLGGHNAKTWFNDVWSTPDGIAWTLVTAKAEWSPRAATALQLLPDGTMFVMGGSNGLLKPIGNGKVFNDVWVSTDLGLHWTLATAAAPWAAREGLQKLTGLYGVEHMIVLT